MSVTDDLDSHMPAFPSLFYMIELMPRITEILCLVLSVLLYKLGSLMITQSSTEIMYRFTRLILFKIGTHPIINGSESNRTSMVHFKAAWEDPLLSPIDTERAKLGFT